MSSAARPAERVLFLIRSLDRGGAERQLVQLAIALHRRGAVVEVATFYDGGILRAELDSAGVPTYSLGKTGRWDMFQFLGRLVLFVWSRKPTVLHGYLSTANLLLAAFKPFWRGARVVWGVRASNVAIDQYDWLTRLTARLERYLSCKADLIIANSEAGKRYVVAHGFPGNKLVTIPNGIDVESFRFDAAGRRDVCAGWGVREYEILVGIVARLDPMKDHPTFLEAARRVALKYQHVRFVCVGDGPADYAALLERQAQELGLAGRIIWAGARDDMAAVYSALDIATSTSFGEGFSNAIAEAMACERPCVVTDVGDSAWIVGETGRVVPPGDPQALAEGLFRMIDQPASERAALGTAARARIESEFGIEALVSRTVQVLGLDRCA